MKMQCKTLASGNGTTNKEAAVRNAHGALSVLHKAHVTRARVGKAGGGK